MLCDQVLVGLWRGLLHAFKHEQIALLFSFPEGHPLRPLYLAKTQATEKAAKGLEVLLRGGPSAPAVEGFDAMIAALDAIVPKVHQDLQPAVYEERAHLLSIREKLKHVEEIMALPEGEDWGDAKVDPKCMN